MKIQKIYDFLCDLYPLETACDFDNAGLLIGDKTADITSAVLALDCTDAVIKSAIDNNAKLIITHHPVIFDPIKKVLKGDIVYTLIENGISVICMHTNLDTGENGVNDVLAQTLQLKNIKKIADTDGFTFRQGVLDKKMSSDDFAAFVGKKLNTAVRYTGEGYVQNIAVCSGSGNSFLLLAKENGADSLVTSEIKHNTFLEARRLGITLIDAGHFNTEDIIIEPLKSLLENQFGQVKFIAEHLKDIKVCVNI